MKTIYLYSNDIGTWAYGSAREKILGVSTSKCFVVVRLSSY